MTVLDVYEEVIKINTEYAAGSLWLANVIGRLGELKVKAAPLGVQLNIDEIRVSMVIAKTEAEEAEDDGYSSESSEDAS